VARGTCSPAAPAADDGSSDRWQTLGGIFARERIASELVDLFDVATGHFEPRSAPLIQELAMQMPSDPARALNDVFTAVFTEMGDPDKRAALFEPWALVDRFSIPRSHLTDDAELQFRQQINQSSDDNFESGVSDCTKCMVIVFVVELLALAYFVVITNALAPQIAEAIIVALQNQNLRVVALAGGALGVLLVGLTILAADGPVCTALGNCS
jgi:hypothetical protein